MLRPHLSWIIAFCLLALAGSFTAPLHAQCAEIPGCVLVWSDEFDGTTVDPNKWSFQIGDGSDVGIPGWGNNELQYYLEDNATVSGGVLTITAREETTVPGFDYTSARLRTIDKGDWTYGRFEIRAKMPIGQGFWPALWLLSSDPSFYGRWAASGEIDIMEYLGNEPDRAFGTIHYGATFPGNVFTAGDVFLDSGTFNDNFHTFAVEWEFGEIRWYLDGVEFFRTNSWFSSGGEFPAPFDVDFHVILNLAVGGTLPGNPDATTVFPQELQVDYVRVYQALNDDPFVEIVSPAPTDFVAPGDVTIQANATDDGSIANVEFFHDRFFLGSDDEAPYEITVPDVAAGCYTLTARARDDVGVLSVSEPVTITVGSGCPQAPYGLAPAPIPGTIEVENYDIGGPGVAYVDFDPGNVGGVYRVDDDVDLENSTDSGLGYNLGFVSDGEFVEYTVDVTPGTYDVTLRVASAVDGGALNLELDGVDITGPIEFPGTGGWQVWTDVVVEDVLFDTAGVQTLRVQILDMDFNVNYITIAEAVEGPPPEGSIVFDDMEHGNPFGNNWFAFGGSVGGGGVTPFTEDLPPENGGAFVLDTGWGSGGVPGFYGGFGRTRPTDLTAVESFSFWINPRIAGQEFTIEINLQEDDNNDNLITPESDDEYQFNCVVGPVGPCAVTGGGWQRVTIPLADFTRDTSFIFGGNGELDAFAGGNGELINVVMAIIGTGSDANFRTDYWTFDRPGSTVPVVWDDFEDGNAFDWIFFPGNLAGGGGDVQSDRPAEGNFYLSTGWGGQGTDSVFYGGFFKNIPEADQMTTPEDPWINFWALNQSNASVEEFTLEVTIREDTDGNGWSAGQEDSLRLDVTFTNDEFDDQWRLISAPLSSLVNLGTGGDGQFNGKLDEMVIVVSGVEGAVDSVVELDLDYFILTSGGPLDPCENDGFDDPTLAAWSLDGIGHSNQFSAEVVGGVLELTSDGATAYLGDDNAGFLYQSISGDFRVEATVDVSEMDTGKEWRKAGLMARASLDNMDLRLLATAVPEQERLQMVARTVYDGPGNVKLGLDVPNAPALVDFAIERTGQTLSVQYSLDGRATWITPSNGTGGSVVINDLPPTLLVGPAVVSNNISVTSTAKFDDLTFCVAP